MREFRDLADAMLRDALTLGDAAALKREITALHQMADVGGVLRRNAHFRSKAA